MIHAPYQQGKHRLKNYNFKPRLIASISLAILLPLFIALGFWQLQRAEQKKSLMAVQSSNQAQTPIALTDPFDIQSNLYRPVVISGEYDSEHQFLLDNQISNRTAGYHVLTPLRIEGSDRAIIIDRGWIPTGSDRQKTPDIKIKQTRVRITGIAKPFSGIGFKFKGGDLPTSGWPSMIQWVEADKLSEKLGYPLRPYQVLLDAQANEGYLRDWQIAKLTPEKNLGYALQWFSFAFVTVVLYVWHGFKPKAVHGV